MRRKQLLTAAIAAAMALSMVPAPVLAADTEAAVQAEVAEPAEGQAAADEAASSESAEVQKEASDEEDGSTKEKAAGTDESAAEKAESSEEAAEETETTEEAAGTDETAGTEESAAESAEEASTADNADTEKAEIDESKEADLSSSEETAQESGSAAKDAAANKSGWVKENGKTYYYDPETGEPADGLKEIDGYLYFFEYDGEMETNLNLSTGNGDQEEHYYFDENGHAVKGWRTTGSGSKYYYDPVTCKAVKGLKKIDGHTYFFTDYGEMETDTVADDATAKKAYVLDADGYVTDTIDISQDGWKVIGGQTYYSKGGSLVRKRILTIEGQEYGFSSDGILLKNASGWLYDSDDERASSYLYCFDSNGHPIKGWRTDDLGYKYYYDPETRRAAEGLTEIDGRTYYFYDGEMQTDTIVWDTDIEKAYIIGSDGYAVDTVDISTDGWKTSGDITFYIKDGSPVTYEVADIGGEEYGFDINCKLIRNNEYGFWKPDEQGNDSLEFYYFDADGHPVKGWRTDDNGDRYYYDPETGKAVSGLKEIDGHTYYFSDDGQSRRNAIDYDSTIKKAYILDDNGYVTDTIDISTDGWKQIGGKWYYFYPYTREMITGYYEIDEKGYVFNSSGAWVNTANTWVKEQFSDGGVRWYYLDSNKKVSSGWKQISGKWYYFDPEYHYMYDFTSAWINGKKYNFSSSGACLNP